MLNRAKPRLANLLTSNGLTTISFVLVLVITVYHWFEPFIFNLDRLS